MKYQRFEDLPVWKSAIDLAVKLYEQSSKGTFSLYSGLQGQIERATVSISNNIAEGFDRGTHEELVTFLYIAMGSAAEVRSMLLLMERLAGGQEHRASLAELKLLTVEISRQLGGWLESLKKTGEKGPRYRNATYRERANTQKRGAAFMEELRRIQDEARNPPPPEDNATA